MAPVSNAERQKRYRERLKQNPVKYEEMRKKHLKRVKLNKLKINEQNQSQQEKTRQKWREYSDRYYKKKKNKSISDPTADNRVTIPNELSTKRWKLKTIKLRKELKRCQDKLNMSLKKQETMRKQIYRLKQERNKKQTRQQTTAEEQPSTPTEFEILSESLSSVYKESTHKEKAVIKKIVNNSVTKKYRMATKIGLALGIKGRIRTKMSFSTKRKLLIQQIHNFYMRDDISRATAGKKECKTKEKTKMQIRFLTDSILNLYTIYKKEGGKASYSTLVRHRPFYVLPPKLHNRETCACIRHANMSYKLTKLYKLGLLKTNKIEELLRDISCDLNHKDCMYGDCQLCVTKKIEVKDSSNEKTVSWLQWCVKTVPYRKKNEEGVEIEALTKKTTREVVTDNLKILVQKFQEEAQLFKRHYYNMIHQQKSFRQCVDNIKENEAVLIVDFSENYQSEYIRVEEKYKRPRSQRPRDVPAHTSKSKLATNAEEEESVETQERRTNAVAVVFTTVQDAAGNMVELVFDRCGQIPIMLIKVIGMSAPYQPQLYKLTVKWTPLSPTAMYQFSKIISQLTEVCLDGSPLAGRNYSMLLEPPSHLYYLSLVGCKLDDEDCAQFAELLTPPCAAAGSLHVLLLATNKIGDEGAYALAQTLRTNRGLHYLNLAGNRITDSGAISILKTLMEFPLTKEESRAKSLRQIKFLKRRADVYANFIKELTKENTSGLDVHSSKRIKPNRGHKVSPEFSTVDAIHQKANIMTDKLVGTFTDPFTSDKTVVHGDKLYSVGNLALCGLNLSYNDLRFPSIACLKEVLKQQSCLMSAARLEPGLLRVRVDGNNLPASYCEELQYVDELLERAVSRVSREALPAGKGARGIAAKSKLMGYSRLGLSQKPPTV